MMYEVRYDPERSTTCGGSQTGDQLCCRELAANLRYYDYFYHSTFWFVIVFTLGSTDKPYVITYKLRYVSTDLISSPLCGI